MAESICRCFKRCGGCQLAMSYEEQIAYKNQKAKRLLSRFARVFPIIPAEDPYRYRNKVQTVYKTARSGEIVSGVFRSSDKGMTVIEDCMLEDRRASEVIRELKPLLGSFRINPYNPKSGKGVLRHTLIRAASKGVMLVLVVNKPAVPNAKGLAQALVKKCPFVRSVVLNVNPRGMPLTLGQHSKVLYGSGHIEDELCGCVFRISPQSFYQVNSAQTEKLYETAISAAGIEKGSRLIDAYCGTGTIGIICERRGAVVAGCELNENAVRDAEMNAALNKCENITFYAEDAGLFATRTAFEDYIKSFNLPNVRKGLIELFKALDTKEAERDQYDETLKPFPYVNGGLFKDENIEIPNFTQEIIDVIVKECAPFNWSEISPTIFGAVFESTLNPETRRKGGMHYTSIQNIHKVIDPLFLDDLKAELSQIRAITSIKDRRKAIEKFQDKIASLKFLDPACGSGNFLTESYLCLAKLEIEALLATKDTGELFAAGQPKVDISQFFGIEINDFAVTVAKTALWIAESQVNEKVNEVIENKKDFLPLTTNAFIVEGNALRMDWATLKPLDCTRGGGLRKTKTISAGFSLASPRK